jgi:hypothetical protein
VTLLDVSRGDLTDFIQSGESPDLMASADRPRLIRDGLGSDASSSGSSGRVGPLERARAAGFSANGTEERR